MSPAARNFFLGVGVFVATVLAYLPAIPAKFIWNDSDYVTAPALRSTTGLARIWFELGATEQYYPILHSAFWVQHKLWGDAPAGYHLINIFLHAGSACLLAAILRRLSVRGAWLSAFVFALHPVYVESVAWISEQKNTLSLFFYLIAALLYLKWHGHPARGRREASPEHERDAHATAKLMGGMPMALYLIATGCFILALLSKSTTATLPPALLVVFWWQRGRLDWRRDVAPLLPWFALGAAMGLFSAYVEKKYIGAEGSEFALSGVQRTLLAGRIAWFYLGKLAWPAELIFIYPRWQIDPAQAGQWVFLVSAVALVGSLWALRRRGRGPLAAILFFGGSLFPVLGFFNVYAFLYSFVADHWQYLPSIGLVVLGAAALDALVARRATAGRIGAPVAVVAALGLLSFHQSRMYADMPTFYRTTVARNPAAWMAHNNLGNLLRDDGEIEQAIAHYRAALQARPDLAKVNNNLGNALRDMKRPREALEHYRRAVEIDPDYAEGHNNLGRQLRELGDKEGALRHLFAALQLDPENPDVRNNLGMALRDVGRQQEAIRQFERALRDDPRSAPLHLNLALSLSMVDRGEEAMRHYEEARRLNPKIPPLPTR